MDCSVAEEMRMHSLLQQVALVSFDGRMEVGAQLSGSEQLCNPQSVQKLGRQASNTPTDFRSGLQGIAQFNEWTASQTVRLRDITL
mgnify:FL=1